MAPTLTPALVRRVFTQSPEEDGTRFVGMILAVVGK